jgi:hypothetical protein
MGPHLDGHARRLVAASQAVELGYGGIARVSRAAGPGPGSSRGGGLHALTSNEPGLAPALDGMVEPTARGDPQTRGFLCAEARPVFPLSNRTRPVDATRPVTSLKTAWETVKKGAGLVCRLHDLRHSFCTPLAEAGVPESTMLDMMGHVSASMLSRDSHIRAKARREAIAALEGRVSLGVPQDSPKVGDLTETKKTTSTLIS